MHAACCSRRKRTRHRSAALSIACCSIIAVLSSSTARTQYSFNPANADEQMPGIRYFGSAKDEKGALVSGAVIRLEAAKVEYVLLTDDQGRFHQMLQVDAVPENVSATCSKSGYAVVRIVKRKGTGPRPSVQVDCVLRRVDSK